MNTRKRFIKAFTSCLLSLVLILPFLLANTITAQAETHSSGLTYKFDSQLNVVITGFTDSTATSLTIPDRMDGHKVVGIDYRSFSRKMNLKKITLPRTLKSIGRQAFQSSGITEIVIPGSVEKIDDLAFANCISLSKVTILHGVESIGDGAFNGCTSLKTVEMGSSPNFDGDEVFYDASTNFVVYAPSASEINGYVTSTGSVLTAKPLANNSECAYKYVVDDLTGEVIIEGYFGDSLTPVIPKTIFGGTVTKLDDGSFAGKRVDKVTLPDTIKDIGSGVFTNTGLKEIEIPSSVTGIGDVAFDDDANLVIKGSCPALDEYLKKCQKIKFTPYGPGAELYHQVTFVSSPAGGGTVTEGVTRDYRSGTTIDISAVPKQTEYLFGGWTSSLGDNEIFKEARASVTELTVPGKDVIITANFEKIPPEPLVIRDGVVLAYYGSGPEVNIPVTYGKTGQMDTNKVPVTKIGSTGYYYNGRVFSTGYVETLLIPEGITEITENAFYGASALSKIKVASNNINYSTDENGILYNKDKTKLICYPAGIKAEDVTIASTVTSIESYAFAGNKYIKKINLNNAVRIGRYAFLGCNNLNEITTNKLEQIESNAFESCTSLSKLILPATIQSIGSSAFSNCSNLSELTWPKQSPITTIESNTFYGCAFSTIAIPDYITTINSYAFGSNNNLETVTLSSSITHFASDALYGSSNLTKVLVAAGNTAYESQDGVLFTKGKTELMIYPPSKLEINYTVPAQTNKIGNGAFAFSNITTIDLSNVTIIGSQSFINSSIKAIDLQNITSIGNSAFKSCNGLTELTIPAISEIPYELLEYSNNITKVIIPSSVTTISSWAFNGCYKLTDVVLPANLKTIEGYAFNGCTNITSIDLPSTLTKIGNSAFASCVQLKSAAIPASVTSIGEYAYSGCSKLETLSFNNCKASIGNYAFNGTTALTDVTIPSTISSLGIGAFSSATNLKTLSIGAKTIGISAFSGCTKLDSLTLLENVETIGSYAFESCKIKEVEIPKTTTSIGIRAFRGNPVESYSVKEGNPNFKEDKGSLYTAETDTLLMYPSSKEADSYTTPSTVTKIQSYAFENADKLNKITFGENTENLKHSLFVGCNNIKTVKVLNKDAVFENLNSTANEFVFYGVNNIAEIMVRGYKGSTTEREVFKHKNQNLHFGLLEDNYDGIIVDIKGRVVGYTGSQTTVSIPSSVTKDTVGVTVVKDSKTLETVTLDEGKILSVTAIGNNAFENPMDSLSTFYKTIIGVEIPMSVTKIESFAFMDCISLTTDGLSIPDSVETIAAYAFQECTALTEVTIPKGAMIVNKDGVPDEGVNATVFTDVFYGCTQLERINVAEGNNSYYSDNGVLMNKAMNKIYAVPISFAGDKENAGTYTMPETIISIGSNAFSGSKLTKINFSSQLEVIRNGAFQNAFAAGNTEIILPESLIEIQNRAFSGCIGLTKIKIPSKLLRIGDNVFDGCTSLNTFEVAEGNSLFFSKDNILYARVAVVSAPDSKTASGAAIDAIAETINPVALVRCPANLVTVNLPNDGSIVQIYSGAFSGCTQLSQIQIPEGVQIIGQGTFSNCYSLTSITFPSTLISIGSNAFSGVPMIICDLSNTEVEIIDAYAFANSKIRTIKLPETLVSIGEAAFYGHYAADIVIPASVKSIGDAAFVPDTESTNFKSVTVQGAATEIIGDPFDDKKDGIEISITLLAPYDSNAHTYAKTKPNITFVSTTPIPETPQPSPETEQSAEPDSTQESPAEEPVNTPVPEMGLSDSKEAA